LRERADFATLVARMLAEIVPERSIGLDREVAAAFSSYAWPGNLRQLSNALRTACALLDDDDSRIGWAHLADDLVEELRCVQPLQPCIQEPAPPVTDNLQSLSEAAIQRAVATCQGNMSEAARRLGISRNTLYRRLRR
jgi:transcriptional regulator of acetoin/glycerol metabolism